MSRSCSRACARATIRFDLIGMLKTAFAADNNPGYISGVHVRDFFNEQLLIGPLGMFLFVAAAAIAPGVRGNRRATALFFLLAGLGFLVACWLIGDSNLGYARDWDLLSHSGIVFTAGALALFFLKPLRRETVAAAMACAIAVSAYHTVPWIATNADGTQHARLKTLPSGWDEPKWWYRRGTASVATQRTSAIGSSKRWKKIRTTSMPLYLLGALDFDGGPLPGCGNVIASGPAPSPHPDHVPHVADAVIASTRSIAWTKPLPTSSTLPKPIPQMCRR